MNTGYLTGLRICSLLILFDGIASVIAAPVTLTRQTSAGNDLSVLQQQIMLYRIKHKLPKIMDYISKHPHAVDWNLFATDKTNRTSRFVDPVLLALLLADDDDLPSYPRPVIAQSNGGLSEEGLLNLAFIEMVTILGLAIISRSPTQLAPVILPAAIHTHSDTAQRPMPEKDEDKFRSPTDVTLGGFHPLEGQIILPNKTKVTTPCHSGCDRDWDSQSVPDVLHVAVNFDGDQLNNVRIINEGIIDRTLVNVVQQTEYQSKMKPRRLSSGGRRSNFRNAFDLDDQP